MRSQSRIFSAVDVAPAPEPATPWLASESVEVPGRPGVAVSLHLDQSHHIFVERPDGLIEGVPEEGFTYLWPRGIPNTKRGGIPGAASSIQEGHDDPGRIHPLQAAAAVTQPKGKLTPALRTQCQAAWKDLWTRFSKHLEMEAAEVSNKFGYDTLVYGLLAVRPDLRDHLRTAPGIAPFYSIEPLREVPPTGWNLNMIINHVIPATYRAHHEGKLPPGAAAWIKNMKWEAKSLPPMPNNEREWTLEARRLVRHVCIRADSLDPNRIQQLKDPSDWLLLNITLGHQGAGEITKAVLQNTQSSLRAVDLYLRQHPDAPEKLADRIMLTLDDVIRWRAEMPDVAARISGFKKMVEETVLWDRAMRQATLERANALAELRASRLVALMEEERLAQAAGSLCREIGRAGEGHSILQHDIDPNEQFAPVPVPRVEFGGYILEHLPTPAALQYESLSERYGGMCHCVVTHVNSCLRGRSHVFSVRQPRALPDDFHDKIAAFRERAQQVGLSPDERRALLVEWKLYELSCRPRGLATIEVEAGTWRQMEFKAARNQAVPRDVARWTREALRVASGEVPLDQMAARYANRREGLQMAG